MGRGRDGLYVCRPAPEGCSRIDHVDEAREARWVVPERALRTPVTGESRVYEDLIARAFFARSSRSAFLRGSAERRHLDPGGHPGFSQAGATAFRIADLSPIGVFDHGLALAKQDTQRNRRSGSLGWPFREPRGRHHLSDCVIAFAVIQTSSWWPEAPVSGLVLDPGAFGSVSLT
jgi:hypothetical protein